MVRAPAGIYHWSSPKPTLPLATFPSSSLLPMTGKNCKNLWSWGVISPSLTLSISCQSSLPITVPVHSKSVSSTPKYLIPILLFTLLLFCTPVFLLAHRHLQVYHSSIKLQNCNYFATMAYLLPYLLTPFAHTVYRFFYCVFDCTFVYPMCNSVLFFVALLCLILAVVNENVFSTGRPGWIKVKKNNIYIYIHISCHRVGLWVN